MNLEARKILIVQEFLRLDNEKIITAVENFLHQSKSEVFEQNLKPMSMEQFNAEMDSSVEDEENSRLINVSDLRQKMKGWR